MKETTNAIYIVYIYLLAAYIRDTGSYSLVICLHIVMYKTLLYFILFGCGWQWQHVHTQNNRPSSKHLLIHTGDFRSSFFNCRRFLMCKTNRKSGAASFL